MLVFWSVQLNHLPFVHLHTRKRSAGLSAHKARRKGANLMRPFLDGRAQRSIGIVVNEGAGEGATDGRVRCAR